MNVLYLSYDGMLEPLGQSQVLSYIKKLSSSNLRFYLISFEKVKYIDGNSEILALKEDLLNHNIIWHPKKYTKNPKYLSSILDLIIFFFAALKITYKSEISIIHCRSYIPTLVAFLLKKIFKVKFLFDMRGFWADERLDGGIWNKKNIFYKIVKFLEKKFIQDADHIVSLTHKAAIEIEKSFGISKRKISVIPTCVDFKKFNFEKRQRSSQKTIIGYLGNVSTWYLFKETAIFMREALSFFKNAELRIINQDAHDYIHKTFLEVGISKTDYRILSLNHDQISNEIQEFDFSVFFIKPTYSKIASCPTKLGELLACGIPCVSNAGIGDVDEIILSYDCGYILPFPSIDEIQKAIPKIAKKINTPGLSQICRNAAEKHFSLEKGVNQYLNIYNAEL